MYSKGRYETYNPAIFHEIDTWNFGVNQVNDYFELKRYTDVVIAPGSDMPYCLVHYVENTPGNGDGWPAQAANPGAYVQLGSSEQDAHELTWQPILLSHKPVRLMPGFYVPALPMMAYIPFGQWDHEHAWITDVFEYPIVRLMESRTEVEMCPYQFTTKEITDPQGDVNYYAPWLLSPQGLGNVASTSNLVWSKLLGIGMSNKTGSNPVGPPDLVYYTKNNTTPDIVANLEANDAVSMGFVNNGTRENKAIEKYSWYKLRISLHDGDTAPAQIGIIIF